MILCSSSSKSIYILENGTLTAFSEGFEYMAAIYGEMPWRLTHRHIEAPTVGKRFVASIRTPNEPISIMTTPIVSVWHKNWFTDIVLSALIESRVLVSDAAQLLTDAYTAKRKDMEEIAKRIASLSPVRELVNA